jgi:hypothetical protein
MSFASCVVRRTPGALAVLVLSASMAMAAFKPGDRVQAWNSAWYDATIVSVGSGSYDGYYYVHYDGQSGGGSQQYIRASNIRPRPGASATTAPQTATASTGDFACFGYNGGAPMFRWYLNLANGTYQQHAPDLTAGRYTSDGQHITFTSGPYAANGWIGLTTSVNGKISKIVLRSRADEAKGPRVNEYANIYCSPKS